MDMRSFNRISKDYNRLSRATLDEVPFTPNNFDWDEACKAQGFKNVHELLIELYINRGMSQNDIAGQCKTTQPTVGAWLRRCGIPRRSRGGPNFHGRKDS